MWLSVACLGLCMAAINVNCSAGPARYLRDASSARHLSAAVSAILLLLCLLFWFAGLLSDAVGAAEWSLVLLTVWLHRGKRMDVVARNVAFNAVDEAPPAHELQFVKEVRVKDFASYAPQVCIVAGTFGLNVYGMVARGIALPPCHPGVPGSIAQHAIAAFELPILGFLLAQFAPAARKLWAAPRREQEGYKIMPEGDESEGLTNALLTSFFSAREVAQWSALRLLTDVQPAKVLRAAKMLSTKKGFASGAEDLAVALLNGLLGLLALEVKVCQLSFLRDAEFYAWSVHSWVLFLSFANNLLGMVDVTMMRIGAKLEAACDANTFWRTVAKELLERTAPGRSLLQLLALDSTDVHGLLFLEQVSSEESHGPIGYIINFIKCVEVDLERAVVTAIGNVPEEELRLKQERQALEEQRAELEAQQHQLEEERRRPRMRRRLPGQDAERPAAYGAAPLAAFAGPEEPAEACWAAAEPMAMAAEPMAMSFPVDIAGGEEPPVVCAAAPLLAPLWPEEPAEAETSYAAAALRERLLCAEEHLAAREAQVQELERRVDEEQMARVAAEQMLREQEARAEQMRQELEALQEEMRRKEADLTQDNERLREAIRAFLRGNDLLSGENPLELTELDPLISAI